MLDFHPIAMAQCIGFFEFISGQFVIIPFNTFMIFAESTVILHRDSRHLYDICKLLNCVDLNSPQMDELIDRVRKDRMFSKNNPSAQLQYNIPEMLNEIIDSRFYESDYKNITQRLLYEDIDYDYAIDNGIAIVAKSKAFIYKSDSNE